MTTGRLIIFWFSKVKGNFTLLHAMGACEGLELYLQCFLSFALGGGAGNNLETSFFWYVMMHWVINS